MQLLEQRRTRGARRAGRSLAPDIHLLSSGARDRSTAGADAAVARRTRDRGNRARLPRARSRPWRSACRAPKPRFATPAFHIACPRPTNCRRDWLRARSGLSGFQRRLQRQRRRTSCMRADLCDEAVRLGRLLLELMPQEPEVAGLLALMLLIDARREARVDSHGAFVRLADQDRELWDRTRIAEGQALLRACLARNCPGSLPDSGRDQRRAQRRGRRVADRLAPDPRAVRSVDGAHAEPGDRTESRGGRRGNRRRRSGAATGRGLAARPISPVPRGARGFVAAAGWDARRRIAGDRICERRSHGRFWSRDFSAARESEISRTSSGTSRSSLGTRRGGTTLARALARIQLCSAKLSNSARFMHVSSNLTRVRLE